MKSLRHESILELNSLTNNTFPNELKQKQNEVVDYRNEWEFNLEFIN